MADAPAEEAASEAPAPAGPSKLPMLVAILNTVGILTALGALVYTKILHKRPPITESQERERLMKPQPKPTANDPVWIKMESLRANLKPVPKTDGSFKLHYVVLSFSMEFSNPEGEKKFQERSARFTDALLQLLGAKEFDEVTSVQGRYLLRTEIQDLANKVLDESLVQNVLFTEFLAQ